MKIVGCAAVAVVLALAVAAIPMAVADDSGDNVVVTRPGVVFHKAGAGDIRGRSVEKSIDAALEAGYTPCRVCFGKELGSMKIGPRGLVNGGTGVAVGEAGSSLPAPPSSTASQPFGLKFRAIDPSKQKEAEAVRDPYEELETRKFAVEYGAFENR